MMKIIIYGTGKSSLKFIEYIEKTNLIHEMQIVCFTDSNSSKWNEKFMEYPIINPINIVNYSYDYIIVASVFLKEIKKDLQQEYGIPNEKIVGKDTFIANHYIKSMYERKYREGQDKRDNKKNIIAPDERIVVYSANIGRYDKPFEPTYKSDNIEYVLFTDDTDYCSDSWNVEYVNNNIGSDVLCARYYKLFAHKWFHEYRYSVWVDSKLGIIGDLRKYINDYIKQSSLLCFPHFCRDSVYAEAQAVVESGKANDGVIDEQITYYKTHEFPDNQGLIESGCLVRRHNDKELQNLMKMWWQQLCKFSTRDQISFPYVVWKNKFDYDISDLYINDCCYLEQKVTH